VKGFDHFTYLKEGW